MWQIGGGEKYILGWDRGRWATRTLGGLWVNRRMILKTAEKKHVNRIDGLTKIQMVVWKQIFNVVCLSMCVAA